MCLLVTAGKHSEMASRKGCCNRFSYKETAPSKLHILGQQGTVNNHHSTQVSIYRSLFIPVRNNNINGNKSVQNSEQSKCTNTKGWMTNLKTIYITYLSTILPNEIPAIFSVHCNLILFYSASPKMTLFGCTLQIHFMPPLFHSLGPNTVA